MPADARTLYPEYRDGDYGPYDYQPIIDSFGEVVLQIDDEDYQGDSRVLYRDGERWGYLQFGWGSCSGCDALQAVDSVAELDALISDLREAVRWGSCGDLLAFFNSHDWEGDYSWHAEEQRRFVTAAIVLLGREGADHV